MWGGGGKPAPKRDDGDDGDDPYASSSSFPEDSAPSDDPYASSSSDPYASSSSDSYNPFAEEHEEEGVEQQQQEQQELQQQEQQQQQRHGQQADHSGPELPKLPSSEELARPYPTVVLCPAVGVTMGLSGLQYGCFVGGGMGIMTGLQLGARGPDLLRIIFRESWTTGLQWGVWLGTYGATACTLRRVRGRRDAFNALGAGAAAGTTAHLLAGAKGGPRGLLTNALFGSVVAGAIYVVAEVGRPAG
mmetsp:Transcript_661/g.2217  ORF Transcript_661/g.2217 Transcript_661/m.2217 type:complete len:246 (-) Transcript_661:88-825(-)